jgi:hypothetical protein
MMFGVTGAASFEEMCRAAVRAAPVLVVGMVLCLAVAGCGGAPSSVTAQSASTSSPAVDRSMCQDETFRAAHVALCGTDSPPGPAAISTEGSVTTKDGAFVQYPNGLRGEITKVIAKADDGTHPDDSHPDFNELVTVTVKLSNTGSTPVKLDNDGLGTSQLDLYYGVNRYQAEGWMTDLHGVQDLPQQLVPGTSATFDSDFTLPSTELGTLAVTFQPGAGISASESASYTAYTFTDVQTLLK